MSLDQKGEMPISLEEGIRLIEELNSGFEGLEPLTLTSKELPFKDLPYEITWVVNQSGVTVPEALRLEHKGNPVGVRGTSYVNHSFDIFTSSGDFIGLGVAWPHTTGERFCSVIFKRKGSVSWTGSNVLGEPLKNSITGNLSLNTVLGHPLHTSFQMNLVNGLIKILTS